VERIDCPVIHLHEKRVVITVWSAHLKRKLDGVRCSTDEAELQVAISNIRSAIGHSCVVINDHHWWSQISVSHRDCIGKVKLVRPSTGPSHCHAHVLRHRAILSGDNFEGVRTLIDIK
jgi:hypothetical protein